MIKMATMSSDDTAMKPRLRRCMAMLLACLTCWLTLTSCVVGDVNFYQKLYADGQLRYEGVWDAVNAQYNTFIDRILSAEIADPFMSVQRFSDVSFSVTDWCGDLLYQEIDDRNSLSRSLYDLLYTNITSDSINIYCDSPDTTPYQSENITYSSGHSEVVTRQGMNCHCAVHNVSLFTLNGSNIAHNSISSTPCTHHMFSQYLRGDTGVENKGVRSLCLRLMPAYELWVAFFSSLPNLDTIAFSDLPLGNHGLPQHLLCTNRNLKIFFFRSSFGNLRIFPSQIFDCPRPLFIEFLALINHDIIYLPAFAFESTAASLRSLDLENLGLEVIDKDAFRGATSLQRLHLEDNRLQHMSGEWFPGTQLLTLVNIAECHIAGSLDVTSVSVRAASRLRIYSLQCSNVTDIHGRFCDDNVSSALEFINLCNNKLESLPYDLIHQCSSLRHLKLDGNNLQQLHDDLLLAVYNLELLDVSANYLTDNVSWSTILNNQTQLVYLNISQNLLSSWTQAVRGLQKLAQLDLSWNSLVYVSPHAFQHMPALLFLNVQGNSIKSFDGNLYPYPSQMSALLLDYNRLSELTLSSWMENVVILDVSNNNLTTLSISSKQRDRECTDISVHGQNNLLRRFSLSCSPFQQYGVVNVSCNNITSFYEIFPDVLTNPCKIETMDISRNPLGLFWADVDVSDYIIRCTHFDCNTHTIESLDMQHCNLQVLCASAFISFSIKFFNLQHNKLAALTAMNMPPPHVIDIRNTDLTCSCFLLWLKQQLSQQNTDSPVKYLASQCTETLSQQKVPIRTVLDVMFLCPSICPTSVTEQCTASACYTHTAHQNQLDAVVCSAKGQSTISPAFTQANTNLQVTEMNLPVLQLPYERPSELLYLNASQCGIETIPDDAFANTRKLRYLILAGNRIETVYAQTFKQLVWLEVLDLSGNRLVSFSEDVILPVRLLHTLYLSANRLSALSIDTLEVMQTLSHISLHGNPWLCECDTRLIHWVVQQQAIVTKPDDIRCSNTGVAVMRANTTCPPRIVIVRKHHTQLVSLSVSLSVILVACLLGGALLYKYHFLLSVVVHTYLPLPRCCARLPSEVRLFAIYDDQDREAYVWIKNELIPHLEPDCPIICSDRDFPPGIDVMDNIEDAVVQTNCALMLMTAGFFDNLWSPCMFEAVSMAYKENASYRIIPVFAAGTSAKSVAAHDKCSSDMRTILKTCKSVHMSAPLFWESVRYLLPASRQHQQAAAQGPTADGSVPASDEIRLMDASVNADRDESLCIMDPRSRSLDNEGISMPPVEHR